jgi:hypothetical protein
MPRPPDFTDIDQAFCDAEMANFKNVRQRAPHLLRPRDRALPLEMLDSPRGRELWYAGYWLGRKLEALGLPEGTWRTVCRGNGREAWKDDDPWPRTLRTLAEWTRAVANGWPDS